MTFEEAAEAVARAFDRACQAATKEPPWEGVYVSPLWENETTGDPEEVRAWKRSILRRIPGAGAEPWGHVFLLVTASTSARAHAEGTGGGALLSTGGGPPVPLPPPLWTGPPLVQLLVRPRSIETEDRLQGFLASVRREFTPPECRAGPPR